MLGRRFVVKALQASGLNAVAHHLYYTHIHGFDTANRHVLSALDRCFAHAVSTGSAQSGDYLEFGLFKGYSFWYAQSVAKRHGLTSMRFFGFDSFCGLPEIGPVDATKNNEFYKGQYACSKEQVERNLDSKGVDWTKTVLIEGYYADSLSAAVKSKCVLSSTPIVLIDCDLYESTAEVLDFIEDLLREGTVLLFDDWNCFDRDDKRGQRRAVKEFLRRYPRWRLEQFFSYGDYGQVFIVKEQRERRGMTN